MNAVGSLVKRCAGWTAPQWYCLAVAVLWLARAGTTLAAGASFALPGDGWRSVFQLAVVAVVLFGIRRPTTAFGVTVAVGITYAALTALELFNGHDLLGVIPVDTRDRFVHPVLAVAAFVCALLAKRRSQRLLQPR
jgi:Domain of unknown function (DUF4383)